MNRLGNSIRQKAAVGSLRGGIFAITIALTLTATAQATPVTTNAWLSRVAGVPVVCFTTQQFLANDNTPNAEAFWGYTPDIGSGTIGLSPAICTGLNEVRKGWSGTGPSDAVFALSHEIAHALGLDYKWAASHTTDGAFQAEVDQIAAAYPQVNPTREAAADCVGLQRSSAIAYELGMRGHQAFALLARFADQDGYVTIPHECRPS